LGDRLVSWKALRPRPQPVLSVHRAVAFSNLLDNGLQVCEVFRAAIDWVMLLKGLDHTTSGTSSLLMNTNRQIGLRLGNVGWQLGNRFEHRIDWALIFDGIGSRVAGPAEDATSSRNRF